MIKPLLRWRGSTFHLPKCYHLVVYFRSGSRFERLRSGAQPPEHFTSIGVRPFVKRARPRTGISITLNEPNDWLCGPAETTGGGRTQFYGEGATDSFPRTKEDHRHENNKPVAAQEPHPAKRSSRRPPVPQKGSSHSSATSRVLTRLP